MPSRIKYLPKCELKINTKNPNGLEINIETERLLIRPLKMDDEKHCVTLFAHPKVIERYATGNVIGPEAVKEQLTKWVERFKNFDAYSGYVVMKKETKEFMGLFILGHGDFKGECTLAGLGHAEFWNQGYAKEVTQIFTQIIIPRFMILRLRINGFPLTSVDATARVDNIGSVKLLRRLLNKKPTQILKFDDPHPRYAFFDYARKFQREYEHVHNRLDEQNDRAVRASMQDIGVDVPDNEMAASSFGTRRAFCRFQ